MEDAEEEKPPEKAESNEVNVNLPKHIGTDMDDQGFIRLAGLLRIKYIFT
jgi:hypothetical protein